MDSSRHAQTARKTPKTKKAVAKRSGSAKVKQTKKMSSSTTVPPPATTTATTAAPAEDVPVVPETTVPTTATTTPAVATPLPAADATTTASASSGTPQKPTSTASTASGGALDLTSSDYYWNSYSHYSIHEEMLKDHVRTDSYRRAIMAPGVVKGKVVVDVGCGTGILSLFCASAGAKKVYAIDCAEIIEQAKIIVKANRFEDVIVLIKGKVEDVELPEKCDVLISEWMGYFLMYESMLDSVITARDKWLKPDGIVLPDKCSLHIAGIEDAEYRNTKIDWWNSVYGYNMSCIREIALSEPLVDVAEANMITTNELFMKEFNVMAATHDDMKWESGFQLKALREEYCHALCVWFDVEFSQSHVMFSTGPRSKYTHWKQAVLYLREPVSMRRGETLSGNLVCTPNKKNPRDLDIQLKYDFVGRYQEVHVQQTFYMH
ncbi:protein arginine N-methyltransferase [Pelomyxa schiedti]|nr:protein arginine N-methyltransferase [Pelomyxa schiedti]